MKRKSVSCLLLLALVAVAVIASVIPAVASPYSTISSVSGSFNNQNLGGSLFSLKRKDKWRHDPPVAVPEESALIQMACVLALFAVVIPQARLLRRKA